MRDQLHHPLARPAQAHTWVRNRKPELQQFFRMQYHVSVYLMHSCVHVDMCSRAPQGLSMRYPPADDKAAVEVAASDLDRLGEEEFLNDTIIDFYLRWGALVWPGAHKQILGDHFEGACRGVVLVRAHMVGLMVGR